MKKTLPHSDRSFSILGIFQALWLVLLFLLAAWWGYALFEQAKHIALLETQLEGAHTQAILYLAKTQRMLTSEGITFFLLLLATTWSFYLFYIRDRKRTRIQKALFTSIAHDLRTPITSLRLQTEVLEERTQNHPELSTLAHRLFEDTFRIQNQVENALMSVKLLQKETLPYERVVLKYFFQNIFKTWSFYFSKKILFHLKIHPENLTFHTYPLALEVLFRNLIENSVRHNSEKNISIFIDILENKKTIEIHYYDSGKGLGTNHLQHLGTGTSLIQTFTAYLKGTGTFHAHHFKERGIWGHFIFPKKLTRASIQKKHTRHQVKKNHDFF